MGVEPYTAANITIPSDEALAARMPWLQAASLAREHPHVPLAFLERLLEACELSGWPSDLAVRRYCLGDLGVEPPDEFVEAHKTLAEQRRWVR